MFSTTRARCIATAVGIILWITIGWVLAGAHLFAGSGMPFLFLSGMLLLVWWRPLTTYFISLLTIAVFVTAIASMQ